MADEVPYQWMKQTLRHILTEVINGNEFGPVAHRTWDALERHLLDWKAENPASTAPALRELLHVLDAIKGQHSFRPRTPPRGVQQKKKQHLVLLGEVVPLGREHGQRKGDRADGDVDAVGGALGDAQGGDKGAVGAVGEEAPEEGVQREEGDDEGAQHAHTHGQHI